MLAVMHLYKVVPNLTVVPAKYFYLSKEDQYDIDVQFNKGDDETQSLLDKMYYNNQYSDNKQHTEIYLWNRIGKYCGCRKCRSHRELKYFNQMRKRFSNAVRKLQMTPGFSVDIIPVDEIKYAEGKFGHKDFYRKSNPQFYATTLQDMLELLNRHIIPSENVSTSDVLKIREEFKQAWIDNYDVESGLIFLLTY